MRSCFMARSSFQPRPHSSRTPGRKFSTRMSAEAASTAEDIATLGMMQIEGEASLVAVQRRLHERNRRIRTGEEGRQAARNLSGGDARP